MSYLARILVVGDDVMQSRQLSRRMRRRGYATFPGDFTAVTDKLSREEHPDLVVINAGQAGDKGCELVDLLKSESTTAHIPVMMLAESPTAALRRRCLSVGVDDLLAAPFGDAALFSRMRSLVRFATMYSELLNRAETVRSFGLEASDRIPDEAEPRTYRVLVAAKRPGDIEDIETALGGGGYRLSVVDDVFAAGARLINENFDAVVIAIDDDPEDALYLCGQLRNNARHFNLPALLVTDDATFDDLEKPYARGASVLLTRPLDRDRLQAEILMLVRRQRARHGISDALRDLRREVVSERLTGVYSRDFLLAHLERLGAAAANWHKHLSVALFQVQNVAGIVNHLGAEAADDLLRQVSDWINALVRAEDLTARAGDNEFCVILPETALEEAQIVVQRISGVLLNTDFGVPGVNEPIRVWLQAGCAGHRADDSAASLLERTRKNLL
jgi:two-component system cell cycle response regulator